jgi:hypothetical protein
MRAQETRPVIVPRPVPNLSRISRVKARLFAVRRAAEPAYRCDDSARRVTAVTVGASGPASPDLEHLQAPGPDSLRKAGAFRAAAGTIQAAHGVADNLLTQLAQLRIV